MSDECVVIKHGTPNTTISRTYVVKSGDTLVKIAKAHGFADWREIYNHPDNVAFKAKRPNPDKIFPGDLLMIPGHVSDIPLPPLPQSAAGGVGGGFGFARLPLLLNLRGLKASDTDLDFKASARVRVTLFWVTNCVKMDTSPQVVIAKTEELYAQHGLTLDILPSRNRTPEHTIEFPDRLIEQEEFNMIRLEGHRRFDDQKNGNGRPRLPIFFCEFRDPANGLTIKGDWLPYNFVSGVLTVDKATMAHEIVHAAGLEGHLKSTTTNLMSEPTHERSEMFKFQVEAVAKAYYSR
jgi:hypothetical protein